MPAIFSNIIVGYYLLLHFALQIVIRIGIASYYSFTRGSVGLVVASTTVEQRVLGSIPGSDKVLLDFQIRDFSNSHGVWICAWLMAVGSPPRDLQKT